jgi:hypothetical protein
VDRTASLTSTATGGGAITLGGGLDDGGSASGTSALVNGLVANDGRPDGYAVDFGGTSIQYGVMFGTEGALAAQYANIKLYSGGGDIRVNGRVTNVVGGGGNWCVIGGHWATSLTVAPVRTLDDLGDLVHLNRFHQPHRRRQDGFGGHGVGIIGVVVSVAT